MSYSFELLGILPVLRFFNYQERLHQRPPMQRAEYVGVHSCSLDRFLRSVEDIAHKRNWAVQPLSQSVIDYWLGHAAAIQYWSHRLTDSGNECLMVARVADLPTLRAELESTLNVGL